jgi:hypothetical protein
VRATGAPGAGGRAVAGQLTIARPGAPPSARRITAQSCDQASDGLALVIVLALDPDAPDPLGTRPPALETPTPAPPPRPSAAMAAAAPPPSRPAAKPRTAWAAEAGAQAIAGPAPRVMSALWVGARLMRDRPGSPWSPALVLSVVHAWAGGLGEPGGTAAFTLDAANLDACPLRLATRGLEARACGSLFVASLEATGSNTYAPVSSRRPFAAGGASLLVAAGLGPRLILGARMEAAASWIRDAYAFSPTVFHRAAAATLAGGLSVGLRFR